MKNFIFMNIFLFGNCWGEITFPQQYENPEIYSGNFSILKDGTILIFYDEHVLQVEEVKHYEKCWCNNN